MCECLFCVCKHPDPLTKLSLGPCHYISCILHKHYLCSCNLAAFQDAASLMCQSWTCNGERGAPSICRHLFCFLLLREAMSPDGLTPPPLCFTAKMAATEWRERPRTQKAGPLGCPRWARRSLCLTWEFVLQQEGAEPSCADWLDVPVRAWKPLAKTALLMFMQCWPGLNPCSTLRKKVAEREREQTAVALQH